MKLGNKLLFSIIIIIIIIITILVVNVHVYPYVSAQTPWED